MPPWVKVLYVALIEFSAHVPVLDVWRTVSLYVLSALIPPRADTRKGVGLKLTVDGKSGVVEVGCPNHFAWQRTARGKGRVRPAPLACLDRRPWRM